MALPNLGLAESALHAPAAGFSDYELYTDFVDKAAVLLVRLVSNHPLPDGNKRAAWVSLRLFVEINGWSWSPAPSIDDAERAVLAIASGEWDRERTSAWLHGHLRSFAAVAQSHTVVFREGEAAVDDGRRWGAGAVPEEKSRCGLGADRQFRTFVDAAAVSVPARCSSLGLAGLDLRRLLSRGLIAWSPTQS